MATTHGEELLSISSTPDGTTTLVTASNERIVLSPKAAAELADHLINSLNVTIALAPHGKYTTSTRSPHKAK